MSHFRPLLLYLIRANCIKVPNRGIGFSIFGNPNGPEHAEIRNRLIKNSIICWNYLFLTQELQWQRPMKSGKCCWTSPQHFTAVLGQFQHAWRFRFLGREDSGHNQRSSPRKGRPRSSLKIGSRQIAEQTPFQQDIKILLPIRDLYAVSPEI